MPETCLSPSPLSAPPTGFQMLVGRIRAGDERGLEQLLGSLSVHLRRMAEQYIGSSLRPHIDADDLVQPVTLILWNGLRDGKFEVTTPQKLMALSRTLLKRQAAKAVQQFKPAMAATVEGGLSATLPDQRIIQAADPAKEAEATEQIQKMMKHVSAGDRRMLELLLSGHSIAAAARLLKVEPSALRMRLSRLRVRVRTVHHIRVQVRRVRRDGKATGPKDTTPPATS